MDLRIRLVRPLIEPALESSRPRSSDPSRSSKRLQAASLQQSAHTRRDLYRLVAYVAAAAAWEEASSRYTQGLNSGVVAHVRGPPRSDQITLARRNDTIEGYAAVIAVRNSTTGEGKEGRYRGEAEAGSSLADG